MDKAMKGEIEMHNQRQKREILIGNETVENWGVFVENQNGETFEIQLSQKLSAKDYDFIEENLQGCKLGENTEGKIQW